jgi:hypothetical protein
MKEERDNEREPSAVAPKPPHGATRVLPTPRLDPDLREFADVVVVPALLSIHSHRTPRYRKKVKSSPKAA